MIRDPLREVLDASLRADDGADLATVDEADLAVLRLARRRFGVGLPPPFVDRPGEPAALPIRPGGASDGAAIAAVQRRSWRVSYRGLISDRFLDGLDFSYLGAYWCGRAAVSPGPRHRLLVAGRPGEVNGVVDTGPSREADVPADEGWGEVRSLYLDPTVVGRGLGSVLLRAAEGLLRDVGFGSALLWVVEGNTAARSFYERNGWQPDGATKRTPVDDEELSEVRYRRRLVGPG